MAVKGYLKPTLTRIARVIVAYAKEQGLERSDFALAGAWQESTGRISLVLTTTKNVEWFAWYKGILEKLQSSFEAIGVPDATWNVGLVILTGRNPDQLYSRFQLAGDEEGVTDDLESMIDAAWAERKPASASAVDPH